MEYAKITGKVSGKLIQVKMSTGESLFAPIAISGINVTLPSDTWIRENKDNFLAIVAYDNDEYDEPVIIGFLPVKGADSMKFNVTERLLQATLDIVEKLLNGKVNTQIGPQPFMPTTIQGLNQIKSELKEIQGLVNKL